MSAYRRALSLQCETAGCTKRALIEVINTYNSSQGRFCRHHSRLRLRELQADEQRRVKELGGTHGDD